MGVSMQGKITEAVEGRVTAAGAEFVVKAQFTNTGIWYVMRGLDTTVRIAYDFQGEYATFRFTPRPQQLDRAVMGEGRFDPWTKTNGMVRYHQGDELRALLDLIGHLVKLPLTPRQMGQVPPDHPDANKPVPWGQHPNDCDCGDCP